MRNLVLIAALIFFFSSCKEKQKGSSALTVLETEVGKKETVDTTQNPVVVLETTMGTFEIELFPNVAPKTVKNFLDLTNKGFYNGLTFHRVIKGFVIQGGDPKGDGTGGPGYTIPAEFSNLKHETGTVAMARRPNDINSAGSQFYICLAPQPALDGQYTIFGKVVSGLDVVMRIGDVPTGPNDRPKTPVVMKKVYVKK
ncbi:MAG: peptidylprolyl isomerase [bacterium]